MRPRLYIASLVIIALIIACKKHTNPPSPNPDLLQHKWDITSLNGEALRYLGKTGDYYDFQNGRLIEYFGGRYDTLEYTLINNNQTLELRGLTNNVLNGTGVDLNIKTLTSSQLILDGSAGLPTIPIHVLDSLFR